MVGVGKSSIKDYIMRRGKWRRDGGRLMRSVVVGIVVVVRFMLMRLRVEGFWMDGVQVKRFKMKAFWVEWLRMVGLRMVGVWMERFIEVGFLVVGI